MGIQKLIDEFLGPILEPEALSGALTLSSAWDHPKRQELGVHGGRPADRGQVVTTTYGGRHYLEMVIVPERLAVQLKAA